MLFSAPTMVAASHSTTMPPAPYTITLVLFSTLSHCSSAGQRAGAAAVRGVLRRRAPAAFERRSGSGQQPRRWRRAALPVGAG